MKEIMDVYNWACPEVPKKIYIKPRIQPSTNFGGRDDQFGGCVESNKFPALFGETEEWLKANTFSPLNIKSISKPITTVEVQQGYMIDGLEREVEHLKQSLINLEKSVSTRLNDYNNLEVDYLNSQGEVKRLEAKLERMSGLEQNHLWLMQQHLDLKKTLGK